MQVCNHIFTSQFQVGHSITAWYTCLAAKLHLYMDSIFTLLVYAVVSGIHISRSILKISQRFKNLLIELSLATDNFMFFSVYKGQS